VNFYINKNTIKQAMIRKAIALTTFLVLIADSLFGLLKSGTVIMQTIKIVQMINIEEYSFTSFPNREAV
jgi:hypothetical protein